MKASASAKSNGQLRAIFAEGKKRGLDHDRLRDMAESITRRTRSLKELTKPEAESMLRTLKGNRFTPLRTLQHRRQREHIDQVVQPAQLKLIAELATQRGWSAETTLKFCERQCGHKRPLTTKQANSVIEALKAMNRREGLWAN